MSETPKSKRGRPKTFDAEEALDVATQAYWREDPVDVSLNAICALAGVSKPALYREFGGEDGLMLAVLDRYAQRVLSHIFSLLSRNLVLKETLRELVYFAAVDAKMETGCVFYKMRSGKHRLGPKTRQRVEEIDAAAVQAFEHYLTSQRQEGGWAGGQPDAVVARYIVEQIGLALSQRAAGESADQVNSTLTMAFSALNTT